MDLALIQDENGGFDIGVTDGDFTRDKTGLHAVVIVSLLCDRRAANDDEIDNDYQGGVWHDAWPAFPGDLIGSRLYLLRRVKQTGETLQRAKFYAEEALAWMVAAGIASAITVTTEWVHGGVLGIHVVITLASGDVFDDLVNYPLEAA